MVMKIKDDLNIAIGIRIKEIRNQRKMTQEELAEAVDFCAQQISDIERGVCGMSVPKLMDFCRALEIDADYLLFGTSTRNGLNPMNKYLSKMTAEQSRCAEELLKAYAKTCGIKI